jgi:hypothetical protein
MASAADYQMQFRLNAFKEKTCLLPLQGFRSELINSEGARFLAGLKKSWGVAEDHLIELIITQPANSPARLIHQHLCSHTSGCIDECDEDSQTTFFQHPLDRVDNEFRGGFTFKLVHR